MKSIFPQSMMGESVKDSELTLEMIISKLTYFQEQTHLLHWQTSSYAEHQALGSLYSYIQSFKDGAVEKLMGYIKRRPGLVKMLPLTNCQATECVEELGMFAMKLKSYAEMNSYLDIGNLADELSGMASKTKYLLTLS
jgi:hypothetical protein